MGNKFMENMKFHSVFKWYFSYYSIYYREKIVENQV